MGDEPQSLKVRCSMLHQWHFFVFVDLIAAAASE
jgi:hypothetical protein